VPIARIFGRYPDRDTLVSALARRYTPAMRVGARFALVLMFSLSGVAQTVPAGWNVVKDAKGFCQIAVPAEWVPFGENNGAAMLHDSTTAIAVVTSQPGQDFKPLSPALVKSIGIAREKLFENTAARLFYQDRTSRNPEDTSAFSSSIPAKNGMCSCHVVMLPSVPDDVAKKIALSLAVVPQT